jgi:hypothetical protein
MIDLQNEQLITLPQAANLVPPARNGKKTHVSTVLRWILKGIDGVKLEGIRIGGRWLTSTPALQRFGERVTPDLNGERSKGPRSPSQRERAIARAERRLERIGI